MEYLILLIANKLGVEPAVLIALLPTLVFIFNLIARVIPDDAVGVLGVTRKIFKILGLYLSNRVSSGVSVNDVTKAVINSDVPARTSGGQFSNVATVVDAPKSKNESGFINPLLLIVLLLGSLVFLSGCAATGGVIEARNVTCANKAKIIAAAQATIRVINGVCPIQLLPESMDSIPESR